MRQYSLILTQDDFTSNKTNVFTTLKNKIMKKLSSLVICCSILLCTIIFFSLNSCSKEGEATKIEPISLSAEKSQYAPYEIVTITTSENLFTAQSFKAKINNIEIIVGANENSASFVLPKFNNGIYNLSFTLNDKNYTVPITVASLSNILSADQYFTEIKTNMNEYINDLNSQITQLEQNSTNPNEYENLKNDVTKYSNLLNDYTTAYNNLSDLDKQEFAKSMAANKVLVDRFDSLTEALQSSTSSLRKANQSVEDYEAGVEAASQAFYDSVGEMTQQIPKIAGCALVAYTPIHPIINAGAILATGILVGNFMVNATKTINAAITLTEKALKPFEFNAETSQTIYDTGVEKISNIQAKYRSLINSDSSNGGNGNTIIAIAQKYNYFKDTYNTFIRELPSIFRPSYIMNSLKNNYKTTTRSIYNQYLSITNISNPNVTLQQLNKADGSIKIKATTTATTDQTFTYDVNYTNSNFTSVLTKTVNAKVIVQSCDLNTILGTWDLEMLNTCYPNQDGTPAFYAKGTLELYQGGQSIYTHSDGGVAIGTFTYNSDCSFYFTNIVWCSGAKAYPPSSIYYQKLYSCGCLSLKLTKK